MLSLKRFLILPSLLVLLAVSLIDAADTEIYKARRDSLLANLDGAAAIIPAAWEGDLDAYRQSNNLFYLTGLEQPEAVLILCPEARSPEALYLTKRNPAQEAWTGKKLGYGNETEELLGIASTADIEYLDLVIQKIAESVGTLYFDYAPGLLDGPVSAAKVILDRIIDHYPNLDIKPLSTLIDPMRVVKDSHEIEKLQRAIDITGEAINAALNEMKPGMYEYEIEATIEYNFLRNGAQRPGYPSIVGSGPNTVILHHNANRRQSEEGELVLMDVGAEFDYYTADITRTVPVNGKFSKRQREIYNVVLAAQQAAIDIVKPGITLADVHKAASDVIDKAGFGKYYIHYTSHFLGMDVHDVGNRTQKLVPGMVFTVEPGIYIGDENIGVRIEDNVLVTENGCRVLSSAIPKTVEEIEALMK